MRRYQVHLRVCAAVILAGISLYVSFFHEGLRAAPQQLERNPAQVLATHVADGFTVASVGDIIMAHPATASPENKPIAAILRAADVSMGNFEGLIVDHRKFKIPANIISHYWTLDSE